MTAVQQPGLALRRKIESPSIAHQLRHLTAEIEPLNEDVRAVVKKLPPHWHRYDDLERANWKLESLLRTDGENILAGDNSGFARVERIKEAREAVLEQAHQLRDQAASPDSSFTNAIESLDAILEAQV